MRSRLAKAARRRSGAIVRSISKRRARAASRSKSTWPSRESRARRPRRSRRTRQGMPSSPYPPKKHWRAIARWPRPSAISQTGSCRRLKKKMHVMVQDRDHEDGYLRHAQSAVTFARDRNLEREAVVDQRALMRDALKRSMGHASFEERVAKGDLIEVKTAVGRSFTTPEMITLERENIEHMRAGQDRYTPLVGQHNTFEHLSNSQRGRNDPRQPRPDHGITGRGGRGQDHFFSRPPRSGGERRLRGGRLRANVAGSVSARRGRHPVQHVAASSCSGRERPRTRRPASLLRR